MNGWVRVCQRSTKEIAKATRIKKRQVKKILKRLLKDKFIRPVYDERGEPVPDLYQVPESMDERGDWIAEDLIEQTLRKG